MFVPQTPSPARQITVGAGISLLVFGTLLLCLNGCGAGINSQVAQCKLDALRVLPDDPMMVTPYDAVDLIHRIKACDSGSADAGKP